MAKKKHDLWVIEAIHDTHPRHACGHISCPQKRWQRMSWRMDDTGRHYEAFPVDVAIELVKHAWRVGAPNQTYNGRRLVHYGADQEVWMFKGRVRMRRWHSCEAIP